MTEQRPTNALMTALLAARQRVPARVHKAGKNEQQRYTYVGHEHVLAGGARDALLENGLVLLLESYEMVGSDSYKTQSGDKQCWRWRGRFALLHTSGERLELTYEATTVPNDKAGFVASTALDRTAHMRVLELAGSDEENPEHDSYEQPARRERKGRAEGVGERPAAERRPAASKAAEPPRTAEWWREQHNKLCDRAFEKANIVSGAADDCGLYVPMLPMPRFSDKAQQHAGMAYDKVPPGYLRQVIWLAKDFSEQPAPVRLHVSHLVARHEIRKLEAEAAERALGQAGAA